MTKRRIFASNPGSTSTKVALFEEKQPLFSANIEHTAEELAPFKDIVDQIGFREEKIIQALNEAGHSLEGCTAFVGRGGSLYKITGGTYEANDIMLDHLSIGVVGFHPSSLGVLLSNRFAEKYGGRVFMVNGPSTDELQDVARITGFHEIYRDSFTHALNQKEVCIRYAASQKKKYNDMNLVVAHMGGGVSVTAHRKGKMVDSNDVIHGDGPMAPTRAGGLPAVSFSKVCYSAEYTQKEIYNRITKSGGLVDHLGTSDAKEVSQRAQNGDKHAKLIYDAMIYQIGKNIGAYSITLKGNVDAILLTGGIAHDKYVIDMISDMAGYIAPIAVYPGEYEMEALVSGALRVLDGEEEALIYSGKPVWDGFDFIAKR